MEPLDLTDKDIQALCLLLNKVGAEVRYDLLGTPDEVIFDLNQLLSYSDIIVTIALTHQDEILQDLMEEDKPTEE